MKNRFLQPLLTLLLGGLCALAGCSKNKQAPFQKEPRITGSASDAPVLLKAEWRNKHLYGIILQVEESTQVRNRNTDEDFSRDVKFRLDFNAEANATRRGTNQSLGLDLTGLMFELIRGDVPLIHYDTRSKVALLEDDQRTTDALDRLIGSKWRYTVAVGGTVLSAEVEANTPSSKALDADKGVLGLGLVKRLFTPHFFRPFLELGWLPENPVKIGDSWPVERVFNAGTVGSVQFNGKCTFRGWQDNQGKRCARLDLNGDLMPVSKLAAKLGRIIRGSGGNELEKGTMSGKIWFDPDQSLPVQSITDLNMTTVINQRARRPVGDTSTNAPPGVKLVVPLSLQIKLKIADQGEKITAQLSK